MPDEGPEDETQNKRQGRDQAVGFDERPKIGSGQFVCAEGLGHTAIIFNGDRSQPDLNPLVAG